MFEFLYRLGSRMAHGANGHHCHVLSVAQLTSLSDGNLLQRTAPVYQLAAASGVTDDERSLVGQLCRVHQPAQLMLVHGRRNGQMGDGAQGRHVEGSMMCRSVFAHQAGAVQAQDDVQPQDGYIVDDIVVSPLGKGTVYVAERNQSLFGHSSGECHGVSLGNANVESALGHLLHHDAHRAACGHGWCDAYNLRILAGQLQQRLAKHILIAGRGVLLLPFSLFLSHTSLHVKPPGSVPHGDILLGRCIAVAFLGVQVQQFGTLHALHLFQDAYQCFYVVAVERPEVADVHTLENVLLVRDGRFHGIGQTNQATAAVVLQQAHLVQPARSPESQGVISFVGRQRQQILLHASYGTVYRHVVVVQDNQDVVVRRRDVVQSFVGQTARHGTVADDGHHLSLLVLVCDSHAQGSRNAVRGMPTHKRVVLAFLW